MSDYLALTLVLLFWQTLFSALTAQALVARNNGPLVVLFGGMYWPLTWLWIMAREWYRFMDSYARSQKDQPKQEAPR